MASVIHQMANQVVHANTPRPANDKPSKGRKKKITTKNKGPNTSPSFL
jgi:hypothetical protein